MAKERSKVGKSETVEKTRPETGGIHKKMVSGMFRGAKKLSKFGGGIISGVTSKIKKTSKMTPEEIEKEYKKEVKKKEGYLNHIRGLEEQKS